MNIAGDATKARFIAAFIDNVIAVTLTFLIVALIPEEYPNTKAVFLVVVYLGYFIIFEALWARTLGKYFQGLIVRKLDGSKGDWRSALIRGLLRIIEVNPVLLGGIPAGLVLISSEHKQRIGDMLAGTVVVSNKLHWDSRLDDDDQNDSPPA